MKQVAPNLWDIDEIGDMVHCYLWEWNGHATLIDCGLPQHGDKILDALVANGFPVHTVKRIILTHADLDHMGGVRQVQQATGANVVCHVAEKEHVDGTRLRQPGWAWLKPAVAMMDLIPGMRAKPVVPDELVEDGDILPEGFMVVHTPGHTPGHISLLHREARLLIAGDALANRREKLSGPPAAFTPDRDAAQRSIWRLAKIYGDDYETVVFGHGPPILINGGKRVRALASQIYSEEM
jgi:glyoxylase-like metal-dependent hydrolase (beta-lactamase superfamily II)